MGKEKISLEGDIRRGEGKENDNVRSSKIIHLRKGQLGEKWKKKIPLYGDCRGSRVQKERK